MWLGELRGLCGGAGGEAREGRVGYFRGPFPSSVIVGESMLANPPLGVSAKCSMVSFGSSYRSTVEVGKRVGVGFFGVGMFLSLNYQRSD